MSAMGGDADVDAAGSFPKTDARQRALVTNKHLLVDHMRERGIEVPAQCALDEMVDASPIPLPLVIKGSAGASGMSVRIVGTNAELARAIDDARRAGGDWVAQEFIPSPTYLVGGIFHRGEPLRLYAGEKLEQHPPRTGPAIRLRSTGDEREPLLAVGVRAIRELGWTGFASVDLMRRADGRYVLLEINPRPWGSIAGALDAGVDLFAPFAELLAGRVPVPDLAFAPNRECRIFPQYLRDARYRSLGGIARALRDLFGAQGREWRHPRFALHSLQRLYAVREQWRQF